MTKLLPILLSFLVAFGGFLDSCSKPERAFAVFPAIPAAAYYAGTALAAIAAVSGYAISNDTDFEQLASDFQDYLSSEDAAAAVTAGQLALHGDLTASGLAESLIVSASFNPQGTYDMLVSAGQSGRIAIDSVSAYIGDFVSGGIIGTWPWLFNAFFGSSSSSSSSSPSSFSWDYLGSSYSVVISRSSSFPTVRRSDGSEYFYGNSRSYSPIAYSYDSSSSRYRVYYAALSDSSAFRLSPSSSRYLQLSWLSSSGSSRSLGLAYTDSDFTFISQSSASSAYFPVSSDDNFLYSDIDLVLDPGLSLADHPISGQYEKWGDAVSDLLGAAAADAISSGAGSFVGSDAVIDGDFIRDRGSIAIPQDYSGIDSYADALEAANVGVMNDAIASTGIDATTTDLTAALDGVIYDGTVSSGWDIVLGIADALSLALAQLGEFLSSKFPFSIPYDILAGARLFSSTGTAPAFDWPIWTPWSVYQIHIDLSDYQPVASLARLLFQVLIVFGVIKASLFVSTAIHNAVSGD